MKKEELKPELLSEIKKLKLELRKISMIIEDRLIGLEEPTKEDIRTIREFEKKEEVKAYSVKQNCIRRLYV